MIRHCDGNDPNLTKVVGEEENGRPIYEPCDCGKTFDDVYHLTIYPHQKF